jgi:AraC-like DNA-binding protein
MELVIHLRDRSLSSFDGAESHNVRVPLLAGPYSKAFWIDPAEFTEVVGIRFRPGAARLFFPVPAQELHNTDVPLEDLYPEEARLLRDALWSTAGLSRQFRVLEDYLLKKLPRAAPFHPAVKHAVREFLRHPGVRAVAEVQSETGLSHTRFIQVFREYVGFTPKLFCRIRRFRQVLERVEHGLPVNWADVAAECGYFDQAHLIHDFRAFSGLTPLAYARFQESARNGSRHNAVAS